MKIDMDNGRSFMGIFYTKGGIKSPLSAKNVDLKHINTRYLQLVYLLSLLR